MLSTTLSGEELNKRKYKPDELYKWQSYCEDELVTSSPFANSSWPKRSFQSPSKEGAIRKADAENKSELKQWLE